VAWLAAGILTLAAGTLLAAASGAGPGHGPAGGEVAGARLVAATGTTPAGPAAVVGLAVSPPVPPPAGPAGTPPLTAPTTPTTPTVPSVLPSAGPSAGPIVIDPTGPGVPTADTSPSGEAGSGVGAGSGGGAEQKPGRFDVPGQVRYAINNWFRGLVVSALNPVLNLLGHTVLATPDVTASGRVAGIWSMTRGVANTVFVLFVVAGGAVVMSYETLQTRYTMKEVAPRLVVAFVAANVSLSVVGEGIGFANALSAALLGQGLSPEATADALRAMLLEPLSGGGIFLTLMGLVCAVLAVVLLAGYVIRVALVVLLVAVAPLALTAHASPHTDGLGRLWWRAILGCLAVQVGQSLTLIVALRVFFNNGSTTLGLSAGGALMNFLIACCLLYLLIRIPVWASRLVFASTGVQRRSTLAGIAKYAVIHHALGGLRHPGGR
jgi:hypothetical protein